MRTLVLSTDPAHSLADALEIELGGEPDAGRRAPVGPGGAAQDEMERNWAAVQDWLGELLVDRGVDRISAEELTVPPGVDELFSLLQIKRHHEDGEFDGVDRRLRADGRDAAPALLPRRRALVAGEGLPAVGARSWRRRARSRARCSTSRCRAPPSSTTSSGWCAT